MTTPSLSHPWQNCTDYIRSPKEIDFQLFPEVPITDFFERTHKSYVNDVQTIYFWKQYLRQRRFFRIFLLPPQSRTDITISAGRHILSMHTSPESR